MTSYLGWYVIGWCIKDAHDLHGEWTPYVGYQEYQRVHICWRKSLHSFLGVTCRDLTVGRQDHAILGVERGHRSGIDQ